MNKLKNKLAFFIGCYAALLFALFLVFNHFYIEKKNKLNKLESRLYSLENSILESFNSTNTLLLRSFNDSNIVFTEQNLQILHLQKNIPKLNQSFEQLNKDLRILPGNASVNISGIIEYYHNYIAYLSEIIDLLKKRSETNTGILPRINHIESQLFHEPAFNAELLGQLQFHTQAYLLYKKQAFVDKISWITNRMESEIKRDDLPYQEKIRLNTMLNNYSELFQQLILIDLKLDFNIPVSYPNQLMAQKENIGHQFDLTFQTIQNSKMSQSRNSVVFYVLLFMAVIISSLVLSKYLTRSIGRPIEWLASNIVKILYNKQDEGVTEKQFRTYAEIDGLYKKIVVLLQYLKDQEDKRQTAQKELKQSEKRFRELTDMLPQSVYETDGHGNFTYVNRAWRKTFGFDEHEIEKGVNVIETIVSETGEGLLGNRKFVHSDFIGVRKDGTTFPAIVYSNQVIKNGQLCGIRGIVIDNTERMKYIELLKKEKEKAEQLDKQKTNYLADMSHELRTPMNALIGFADLLASLDLNHKQKEEFIEHINISSQHILSLIDDIIDLAKIESGDMKVYKEQLNINEILTEEGNVFEENLRRSGKDGQVSFTVNVPELSYTVHTDATRLKQVIGNLLSNALKFTTFGFIELGYELKNNNLAKFYVKDSGKGINTEHIDLIFDRFQQATKGDALKGKGLGLAISKKIMEMLGGKIWVESELNKGTSFYFTLPVLHHVHKANVKNTTELQEYNWTDKLILVAEDEELNFRVVKEFVTKTGAKVMRAYDGDEVVDLCRNNAKIDLVLMDIKMPHKNGYDATREIKEFNPRLPVIALTAYALTNEKEKCLECGCNDYIAKPIKKEVLLLKLNAYLSETAAIEK